MNEVLEFNERQGIEVSTFDGKNEMFITLRVMNKKDGKWLPHRFKSGGFNMLMVPEGAVEVVVEALRSVADRGTAVDEEVPF